MKKYYENPEAIQKNSESLKRYYEEHPEGREQMSKIKKKYYEEHPEAGKEHGERMKKYYEDNPEARKKNSEKQKNRSPEWIKKRLDTCGKNKPFDMFTKKDGKFIKTFTYIFEAKEYLQKVFHITSAIEVGMVLSGKRGSSAGFIFKYKEN